MLQFFFEVDLNFQEICSLFGEDPSIKISERLSPSKRRSSSGRKLTCLSSCLIPPDARKDDEIWIEVANKASKSKQYMCTDTTCFLPRPNLNITASLTQKRYNFIRLFL